ncbi:uncharacterized protein TNCV_2221991 [Trichonephila clavipes]|nr:uncharacterized protein TNCV_2221991 [Trichonephila clavipes]
MYTNEEYCEMVLFMGKVIEIREKRQDFMPLNFLVEDIHLIVQLPVLFNACIKMGIVIDVFPYLVPYLQRIPAADVVGYALAHPESSVRDIGMACSYSKSTVWNIRVLYTYGAYPYSPVLAQELMPGDQERSFDFCNFVLNTLDGNLDFLMKFCGRMNASSRGKAILIHRICIIGPSKTLI